MTEISLNDKMTAPTAAALGIFDGVHLGHRKVLSEAVGYAREKGLSAAVFTFNTSSVTTKGRLETLMTDAQKKTVLAQLGIEYLLSADFPPLKEMTAEEFVSRILVGCMNVKCAVCGDDFRFGKGGTADSAELTRLCKSYGIETITVPQLEIGGEPVSSTRIRELIKAGGIARAGALMGRRFGFELPVIHGFSRGHTWGFPTINQELPENVVKPRFGVYCSKALVDGRWLHGITNIGVKPTVEDRSPPLAETYLIDFSGDLYGRVIPVELYEFVRPEMKFSDFEELKAEIRRNTEFAKRFFGVN
ncbi:MAG: riboflavin biosynthesis protein RibF [Ruminococcus sp.]|nr:riboflavin biosynthesis protein RibF [Ruminococcus sp.]